MDRTCINWKTRPKRRPPQMRGCTLFQAPRSPSAASAAEILRHPARSNGNDASGEAANRSRPLVPLDWRFVWQGRRWIVASMAFSLLLGIGIESTLTARYRAVTELLIGPSDLRVVDKEVVPRA
jgi:hypothetical protein